MLRKAKEDFPNLEENEAMQMEANTEPGREAEQGEGQPGGTGIVGAIKESVSVSRGFG